MRWLPIVVAVCATSMIACGDGAPSGACEVGETRPCYSGPPGTEGVGRCAPGIETCFGGTFSGTCVGDVVPFVEHCDGVDEDCNGEIDDVEGTGEACTNADDCDGTTACSGPAIVCVGPQRNECNVCDGVAVPDVGGACTGGPDNCSGSLVCNGAGDGTACNAPAENACGLCGGPAVTDLDQACIAATGCDGQRICNDDNDASVCSCNPKPGMCLANGTFRAVVSPGAGDLVITEIMQSPSGDDTKQEWFEVQVMADVDLNQLELDRVGDTLDPDLIESVNCIPVTTGTRLLMARSAVTADNGGLPAVDFTFSFSLVASSGDITLRVGGTLVDQVTWATSGSAAQQLDPDSITATANDDPNNFCAATTSYNGGADLGTPGQANLQCPIVVPPGSCVEGGVTVRPIVPPPAGQLVITEVFPDPVGAGLDATHEWFELTNIGPGSFDLNGLGFRGNGTGAPEVINSTDCLVVPKDAFVVFARSSAAVSGLPRVDFQFGFSLANTNGSLNVFTDGTGTALLDAITWTNQVTDGRSRMLKANQTTSTANDDQANNFCSAPNDAAHDYDGPAGLDNFGTPGAVNDCP